MTHTCHAHDCDEPVPARLFACKLHWLSLRKSIRDAILREYRSGQEHDKQPSQRYLAVQRLAVSTLAFKPFDEAAAKVSAEYLLEAQRWRLRAIRAGEGDPLEGLIPEERAA